MERVIGGDERACRSVAVVLAFVALLLTASISGCVGDGDREADRSPANGSAEEAQLEFVRNGSEIANDSRYTTEGFPVVSGVGDGVSLALDERVLWMNATDTVPNGGPDTVVVNLSGGPHSPHFTDEALYTVEYLEGLMSDDRRLEPADDPEHRDNVLRRYLADAMVRQGKSGPVRQTVVVHRRGMEHTNASYITFEIGGRWQGGPVIDPADPPHRFVLTDEFGDRPHVTLERDGDTIVDKSVTQNLTRDGVIHTFRQAGNYTVHVESDDETYVGRFTVKKTQIGDCNPSNHGAGLDENGSLEIIYSGRAAFCTDPAD